MMNTVFLGEVAHVAMGSAPPGQSYNGIGEGFPLIAGAGDYGEKFPEPKKWTTAPTRVTEIGDLIVCVRATIGDLNWADKKYCLGRGVAGLRPKKGKLDINFAAHYINAKKNDLAKLGTGSTFLAVRRADLEEFPIPLPPLVEQKRIAAILDKADAILRKRQQAIKLADDFLRATFLDMFGDPVTNPKGWNVTPLSKLCDVRDGTHDSPKYVQSGYPLVTSKNVKGGFLDFSDINLISEEDFLQISKRSAVEKGDIIMPMIGTIGNPVLIETTDKFAIKNVALIKFKDAKINNNYVLHLLKSDYFEWIIQKSNRGGTQKFIALKDVRGFPIPVPDKTIQGTFVDFCTEFKSHRMKANTINSIAGDLFNSLTQRAFRGEL